MSEPRPPLDQALDQALDLLVFAPLGLAALAREQLPGLVQKGRDHWSSQATMAKVVGEFAVGQGRREATKLMGRASDLLTQRGPGRGGGHAGGSDAASPASPATATAASVPAPSATPAKARAKAASVPAGPIEGAGSKPPMDQLAIPGYDALSAPQVVSRLDGLSSEELEAVRAYEQATRGRKTILGRVAQLQALLD